MEGTQVHGEQRTPAEHQAQAGQLRFGGCCCTAGRRLAGQQRAGILQLQTVWPAAAQAADAAPQGGLLGSCHHGCRRAPLGHRRVLQMQWWRGKAGRSGQKFARVARGQTHWPLACWKWCDAWGLQQSFNKPAAAAHALLSAHLTFSRTWDFAVTASLGFRALTQPGKCSSEGRNGQAIDMPSGRRRLVTPCLARPSAVRSARALCLLDHSSQHTSSSVTSASCLLPMPSSRAARRALEQAHASPTTPARSPMQLPCYYSQQKEYI